MKSKTFTFGLLPRVLLAIGAGILVGAYLPDWLIRLLLTYNMLFSELLGFIVPLIIVGFVTTAIADVGNKAGKLLVLTTLIAYGMTVGAGILSYYTADTFFPDFILSASGSLGDTSYTALTPYFSLEISPLMDVVSALALSFILGIGLSRRSPEAPLRGAMDDLSAIIHATIRHFIIPLLPPYIFGIFVEMVSKGQVAHVLSTFAQIILIIFALHILLLLLQYSIAGLVAGRNPFRALYNMLPAYFTALGTQSSAATIPVTLEQVKKNGVSEDIAGFVVPLCATIHLAGSMLKIVACAVALMLMQDIGYTTPMMLGFILMLAITMVAAPGVPGGAIMAALGVLENMLGFDNTDQALMIALYIAMDSFGTAANVTGDGAIAIIINRVAKTATSS